MPFVLLNAILHALHCSFWSESIVTLVKSIASVLLNFPRLFWFFFQVDKRPPSMCEDCNENGLIEPARFGIVTNHTFALRWFEHCTKAHVGATNRGLQLNYNKMTDFATDKLLEIQLLLEVSYGTLKFI